MSRMKHEYPPEWHRFQRLRRKGLTAEKIGFTCTDGDANRFANRYRLAKAFEGFTLQDSCTMRPVTLSAYSAMCRVFLAYSAWEAMHGNNDDSRSEDHHDNTPVASQIRKRKSADKVIRFLRDRTRTRVRTSIEGFLNGKNDNVMKLAEGVRHIFAHGYLTASANDASPAATRDFCNLIADFVMERIDQKFGDIVRRTRED